MIHQVRGGERETERQRDRDRERARERGKRQRQRELARLQYSSLSIGTMTGGGNKVVKGRMSSKLTLDVTPAEMQQLQIKLDEEENKSQVSA